MTTTPALVAPKTCSRCKGSGIVSDLVRRAHLGVPGLCFKCNGFGQVEGDKATIAAQKAEAAAAEARWAVAVDFFQAHPREVRDGFNLLEVLEPERAAKAVLAIVAGHPAVADALVAYFTPANCDAVQERLRRR